MPQRIARRRTEQSQERAARALELRRRHLSYDQIARELGYANRSCAYHAVARARKALMTEASEDIKRDELARLDDLARFAERFLRMKHLLVSQGRVMRDPDTDQPLIDITPNLAALDRLIKIQERRARALGTDAPLRAEVRSTSRLDAEIEQLLADLTGRQAVPVAETAQIAEEAVAEG